MENETIKKLVNQWKQLYILIHKRQDLERIELPAYRIMANFISEFIGINLNNKMAKTIRELWLVIFFLFSKPNLNVIDSCIFSVLMRHEFFLFSL
jgi:hypothetical protein